MALGKVRVVEAGGFSAQVPLGYFEYGVLDNQLAAKNRAGTILMLLQGTPFPMGLEPEAMIDAILAAIAQMGNGKFEKGPSYSVTIDGVKGLAVDVTGTFSGLAVRGRAVAVMHDEQLYLGFGLAVTQGDPKLWEREGSRAFDAFVGSVKFLTSESSTGACVISTDMTYGYTKENPIKVGGGAFDGPPREEAYLDNLLGPNGETLTYDRQGSLPFGDTILDIYAISGLRQPVTLYVDEYNFTEPEAPLGFTCKGAFPLTEP